MGKAGTSGSGRHRNAPCWSGWRWLARDGRGELKLLTRRGVLVEEEEEEEEEEGSSYLADAEADSDEARSLRPLQAAACT